MFSFCFAYADDISSPILHEQQRQIYEKLQNIDTKIPSSKDIGIEANISIDQNDTVCFPIKSITLKNMTLFNDEKLNELIHPEFAQILKDVAGYKK